MKNIMFTNPEDFKEENFVDTKALAELLDVTPDWLNHNRISDNPIPYLRIDRRRIIYHKKAVLAWIGRKDLSLQFYSTKTLAKKLSVSVSWLKHNRKEQDPIPFRRFGYLVRYQHEEVFRWLRKNSQANV